MHSLSVPCSIINVKRAVLNSSDENIHLFAAATGFPSEIRKDPDIFIIKNPETGIKWKLPVADKGHKTFSFKWWLKTDNIYFDECDFIIGFRLRTDTYCTRFSLARTTGNRGETTCRKMYIFSLRNLLISGHCSARKGYRINQIGIWGILLDVIKSMGWTVVQEFKIKDTDGNAFIPNIVVVSENMTIIIYPISCMTIGMTRINLQSAKIPNKSKTCMESIKSSFTAYQ